MLKEESNIKLNSYMNKYMFKKKKKNGIPTNTGVSYFLPLF